jgi:phosphatidylserine decarboxylase
VNIAREGMPFVIGSALAAAAVLALGVVLRAWPVWLISILLIVIALWVAYFFRDPEREGPRGERLVIAPADGRVVMITKVDEPTFVGGRATRISIFMNIFDVHVNRYPVSGVVTFLKYQPGRFLDAHAERASIENEQSSVGIRTAEGPVLMRQIAGLIARRIITYSQMGDRAQQGARMGLIRFGSRVDVLVPEGTTVRVAVGDKPLAGTTVLAELP